MRQAKVYIGIGGIDVSSNFTGRLLNLSVTDASGASSDTASISLDDSDGVVKLPKIGAKVTIGLGWERATIIFEGVVDNVSSRGDRSGGRTIELSAKSADVVKGKLKQPEDRHKDNAKLGDVAKEWGKEAGLVDVGVHPDLASITRDYWSMDSESFMEWGARVAAEEGATFKVMGDRAVFVPRSAGISASGRPLAAISAAWGENLISWDIQPANGRPQVKKSRAKHFDEDGGEWDAEDADSEYDTDATAHETTRFPEPNRLRARRRAKSKNKESDRNRGSGSITIDGDTSAQAEATCLLGGARPGIDGVYRIDSVTHTLSRGQGFTTSLSVKQPSGKAGVDDR